MKITKAELNVLRAIMARPEEDQIASFFRGWVTAAHIQGNWGMRIDYMTLFNLADKGLLSKDDSDWRWVTFRLTGKGKEVASLQ